jgi:hypothetical protein
MARLRPRSARGLSAKWRMKKMHIKVEVYRYGTSGLPSGRQGAPFSSCVRVASGKKSRHHTHCAFGKNPRKATAAALRRLAKTLSRRKGAFAGL